MSDAPSASGGRRTGAAAGSGAGEWRRTDPLGLVARMAINLQKSVLPLIAVMVGGREWGGAGAIIAMILLVLFINGLAAWLAWRQHRYLIGSDDIRVERGLISRSARSVPYERIQDVAIEEALIPRLMGLVEVRLETGAGGKDEVKLAYVSRAEGEALRRTVRARQAEAGEETAGEERWDDEAPSSAFLGTEPPAAKPLARVLFAMDGRRLLTFGLFEFSLVIFAVLAGAADQFSFLLPFNIWEPREWQDSVDLPLHLLTGVGLAAQVVAAILGLVVIGLLGLATGIIRTVLRDYGFRLEETERGLRRRRGLLTRTDVVMPVHRVQALTLTTGIVRRRFGPPGGWHALAIVSLSQDAKSASHTVVPFGGMDEIATVAEILRFALPDGATEWGRSCPQYYADSAMVMAGPLGIAAIAIGLAGFLLPALGLAALAVLMGLWQLRLWRINRHALTGQKIFVRRGGLAPRLDMGSRVKLQSAEIVQGPLARRRGYATLVFGVAGGSLAIRGIQVEEARSLRANVLESIAEVDFSRLSA